jgi:TolB-like protein/Tfp pilus assembly protein PilF
MSQIHSFGPFRFDPASLRLSSGGREIRLTPKAASVLDILLSRAGEPVTKRELFALAWPGTVVGDDALVSCIQELRKALGDDARDPRYIETRHRSGYRFIADSGAAPAAAVTSAAPDATPRADLPAAIAVLPFTDMSPERDQDYFCEGLAEELIDALGRVEGLRIAARSSSFQFRGSGVDLIAAGRKLGVDSIVEGSVRKAGHRVRITVQLIDVATGFHRWSQRFEREIDDIFAIQDEIASSVARTMRGTALTGPEQLALRKPQTAAEPYEYYLRGRQSLHRMRREDLEHSRAMFRRAIEHDQDYAPAWAGLATASALLYEWWGSTPEDLREADRASERAMQLAPDLAESHVARGYADAQHRRYDECVKHFEAAIRLHPGLYDAYYYFGRACFANGRIARSAELFELAASVHPEDFQSQFLAAQSLAMLGRQAEALEMNRRSLERAERALALNPEDVRVLSLGSGALHFDGQLDRALEWSRRALELQPDDMSALINATCLYAKLGMKREALDQLEKACSRGWGKRDWIENDPDYDCLRDEPRFKALMARLS